VREIAIAVPTEVVFTAAIFGDQSTASGMFNVK
jgi:hypothetical protein